MTRRARLMRALDELGESAELRDIAFKANMEQKEARTHLRNMGWRVRAGPRGFVLRAPDKPGQPDGMKARSERGASA